MKSIKKISKIFLSIICCAFFFGTQANFALADGEEASVNKYDNITLGDTTSGASEIRTTAGMSETSVPTMIGTIIKVILGFSGTIALIFIIWGGIKWMISKGEAEQIKKARQLMTSGIIGIAIIAAAYAITDFVIKQITVVAA